MDYSKARGYYGRNYDRCVEQTDSSTVSRMQQQYWATKQAFYKKFGKKEDDCIIASDLELDSKLELFRAIEESCTTLLRVLENYQDKLCILSQEENSMGRFLKECGKQDKTRAGKMMTATGKTLSYTAQQRLSLRVPLIRLYQEVETFQYRAIVDTFQTIEKMEKFRTTYRGALLWMKDISQQLDPDMYKQLEKFRKVQSHVRKTKTTFERLKIDTLQKVDLLSASRCNMFSHVLATYQDSLLQFWEKSSKTMSSVAKSFRGYQHYEFSMLKELTESSKKLAEETSQNEKLQLPNDDSDKDTMFFFESEFHDDEENLEKSEEKSKTKQKSESLQNLFDSPNKKSLPTNDERKHNKSKEGKFSDKTELSLVSLDDNDPPINSKEKILLDSKDKKEKWPKDLLTNNPEVDDFDKDDLTLLSEILNAPSDNPMTFPTFGKDNSFSYQWQSAFGDEHPSPQKSVINESLVSENIDKNNHNIQSSMPSFLPSQLLEMNADLASLHLNAQDPISSSISAASSGSTVPPTLSSTKDIPISSKPVSGNITSKKEKKDMSAWFNLFADLDPLANPDAIGTSKEDTQNDDRNC